MEFRKLISFGKNSYVVSLPKNWVRQNKLKKGDLIYIEETPASLVLSKKDIDKVNEEKERIINIDGKTIDRIEREVNSAYILNNRIITLKGKEIKDKIKELQKVIQNLIALEIMEQTSDSIIAKDFLNMDKVSVEELIRKMDVVTKTMIKESSKIFTDDNYENINERDKDVNRLYFLLYRTFLYNLENPTKALKNLKLDPINLFKVHSIGFYVEGIADEARRSARYARQLKIPAADKVQLEAFINKINNYYCDSMKAVFTNEPESALKLSNLKKELNTELDAFEVKNRNVENYASMIGRFRRMISYIHNIGRTMYTLI